MNIVDEWYKIHYKQLRREYEESTSVCVNDI